MEDDMSSSWNRMSPLHISFRERANTWRQHELLLYILVTFFEKDIVLQLMYLFEEDIVVFISNINILLTFQSETQQKKFRGKTTSVTFDQFAQECNEKCNLKEEEKTNGKISLSKRIDRQLNQLFFKYQVVQKVKFEIFLKYQVPLSDFSKFLVGLHVSWDDMIVNMFMNNTLQ